MSNKRIFDKAVNNFQRELVLVAKQCEIKISTVTTLAQLEQYSQLIEEARVLMNWVVMWSDESQTRRTSQNFMGFYNELVIKTSNYVSLLKHPVSGVAAEEIVKHLRSLRSDLKQMSVVW